MFCYLTSRLARMRFSLPLLGAAFMSHRFVRVSHLNCMFCMHLISDVTVESLCLSCRLLSLRSDQRATWLFNTIWVICTGMPFVSLLFIKCCVKLWWRVRLHWSYHSVRWIQWCFAADGSQKQMKSWILQFSVCLHADYLLAPATKCQGGAFAKEWGFYLQLPQRALQQLVL